MVSKDHTIEFLRVYQSNVTRSLYSVPSRYRVALQLPYQKYRTNLSEDSLQPNVIKELKKKKPRKNESKTKQDHQKTPVPAHSLLDTAERREHRKYKHKGILKV
jgi:hypothetical protein